MYSNSRDFLVAVFLVFIYAHISFAAISNKSPTFINTMASILQKPASSLTAQTWRFDGKDTFKITSDESFTLVRSLTPNKPLSQKTFDAFMQALSRTRLSPAQKIMHEKLKRRFGKLPIKISAGLSPEQNWQLWIHLLAVEKPVNANNNWLLKSIAITAPYYLKKYEDDPTEMDMKTIDGQVYRIYRPDHALAHAMRKAALSLDLIKMVKQSKKPDNLYQIILGLNRDIKNFEKILPLAMLLLRAGRQSEDLDDRNSKRYSDNSAAIFEKEAKKFPDLYRQSDILDFVQAIKAIGDSEIKLLPKQAWLKNLLYAVHHLDLLRISSFGGGKKLDVNLLYETVAKFLGVNQDDPLIRDLFERASIYLDATGDADVPKKRGRTDQFFIQGNDPMLIFKAIQNVGGFKV